MVIQTLIKLSAKKGEEIKKIVNRRGNIGEAAQELLEAQEGSKKQYSLDAFQNKTGPRTFLSPNYMKN